MKIENSTTAQVEHITLLIFSKKEIEDVIENFKESRKILNYRKSQNLSFRKFRRIIIELSGVKENAL